MGFFDDVFAATTVSSAAPQQPDPWLNVAFIAAIFAVMYFFVIRPQSKKQKALKEMIDNLEVGDEIVTVGGISGIIVKKSETFLDVKIADNVQVCIQKAAVSSLLPKGTLEF
ncbi:preprotein translocase subunit YajC [Candidatus Ichthyocystis hellenicum]|uniref:preprotein translocase subunit YajC n=1 Tax=Candidatus Ichthyocystis hellenicum TaxID=1561003 RepID=UPI000B88AF76|nr:preprotein translocase subunit YajC [Candidatus Ichthyocystis hellenicum]